MTHGSRAERQESMLAAVLRRTGPVSSTSLALEERPKPSARPGEVVIEVEACGLCRTDLHVVTGELEPRRAPLIPGHQVVGTVVECGPGVARAAQGQRVGIAWLHRTCGRCRFCVRGDENLCAAPEFTGWSVDGGLARFARAPWEFVYPLPLGLEAQHAAPLLCAGIIGYRCLRATELDRRGWKGARLGLYGFGAAGHIAIQLARARGAEVFVCTRDRERHQALALELGAAWVGDAAQRPPQPLDAALVFAPAGELVPTALAALDAGATLVLGGIHMSAIPSFEYALLYRERRVRSVTNNTRADGRAFLEEAARIGVATSVQSYALDDVNRALQDLATDGVRGAAVIDCRRN